MEVVPGIHQVVIPLPGFALKSINVYLIQRDQGWLLVDCGWNRPEAFNALQQALSELNLSFKDIRQIIVTHIHPDHFGMVGRLKELCGCPCAMSEIEANLIESRYVRMDKLLADIGDFLGRHGVPSEEVAALKSASLPVHKFVVPAQPEIVLRGGETINAGRFNFKVMWTPGHSPGHICLYEGSQKILLAGDQVLLRQTPNVSLHAQQQGNPLKDFLQSLHTLDQLDVSLVLAGHDDIFSDLHGRVKELIAHHDHRNEEVLGILDGQGKTAYDVAPRISWVTDAASWRNLSSLDKRFAVLETLAHLEYLHSLGKAQKTSTNGKVLFKRVASNK